MTAALAYRETLPLAWRPAIADTLPAAVVEQDLRVLAAIAALAERTRVEPDAPGAAEFERLHHKVDLMIELLGALLRSMQGLPDAVPLQLSGGGLRWTPDGAVPPPGTLVDVSVYLHPAAPAPLRWLGDMVAGEAGAAELRWRPMPEALLSALEQYVFIRHRRSVAGARSPVHRGEA
ncbi:PilZ domain-containing protein [Solimonas soli]|uniref:PilZ domain-containing protein n=1 Tax=Solimonas soli TaxID=413479 RepID=UPI000482A40D|nr:PilZ domain-containing protein [Solimonas soli]